jgi:hypothetical protein
MVKETYFGSASHHCHNQAHHTPDPLEIPGALGIVDGFGCPYIRKLLPRLGARKLRVSFVVVAHQLGLTWIPLLVSLSSLVLVIDVLALTDVLALKPWLRTGWLI